MSPSLTRISGIAAIPGVAATLLLTLFVALALTSMRQKSATWDETHYLGIGAYLLQEGRWDVPSARLHPPLSFTLNSLPLLLEGTDVSGFETGGVAQYGVGIARGRRLLASSRHGPQGLLFLSRRPTVAVGALLGWFVFLWARALYGPAGGLLSVFLYALSPNLLAHTRLITPDLCLTAFGFIAFYHYWRGMRSGSRRSLIASGLFLGLTLLSKYSALLWPPVYLAVSLGEIPPRVLARRLAGVFAIAGGVLLVGYGLRPGEFAAGLQAQLSLVSSGGEVSFLNGEISRDGWWYYYLYALLVKLPLATLILVAVRGLMAQRGTGPGWRESLFLLAPPAVFLVAFSLLGAVNNGLRYVLPGLPFLLVWVGGVARVSSWAPVRAKRAFASLLAFLLAWYAAGSLAIHPHPLAHFNELVGGPRNGYRHLLDSNLDWGQDLPGLATYLDEHGIEQVKLCYFGTADPAQHRIDYLPLPGCTSGPGQRPARRIVKGDVLAISATHLYPLFVDLGDLAAHFRSREPIARVGYSILVYRSDIDRRLPPRRGARPAAPDDRRRSERTKQELHGDPRPPARLAPGPEERSHGRGADGAPGT